MKKVLTIFVIVLLCHSSTHAQDCFSYAGEDSRTCSFQDTLIGTPSGGEWFFTCIDSTKIISLEELNDSSVIVTYLECGIYTFEYAISIDSCFAIDTIAIDFENPSTADFTMELEIDLQYQNYDCHEDEATSCNASIQMMGTPPIPLWSFIPVDGFCNSTIYTSSTFGVIDGCFADSIWVDITNHSSTLDSTATQNYLQEQIIVLDNNEEVVANDFFNIAYLNHGLGINQMIDDCPTPMLCHMLPPECLDTLLDTIILEIPIHYGGYWTLLQNGNFIEFDTSFNFMIDSFNYWLNVKPSIDSYNATFELQEITDDGDTIIVTNAVALTLQWEENWSIDTILKVDTIFTVRDSCCTGGTTINRPSLEIPPPPIYVCDPFTLTFNPGMQASEPVITCSDSTYIVEVSLSGGIPPYFSDGLSGTINNNTFTSDSIPMSQVHFSINFMDSGNCDLSVMGDICPCLGNGNTADFELITTKDCGSDSLGTLLVNYFSGGFPTFTYSIDSTNFQFESFFDSLGTGDYTLYVKDSFSCITTLEFMIDTLPWLLLEDYEEEVKVCGEEEILLRLPIPENELAYHLVEWDDGDTSKFKLVNGSSTYQATIYDLVTCSKFKAIFYVQDISLISDSDILVPNAFTPNGDRLNDDFTPIVNEYMEVVDYSLSVFNRWGNRVFYTNDFEENWKPEGQEASDVYIWFLDMEIKNCKGESSFYKKSGDLTLIR